ncbi:hypothetical protein HY417_04220 [Candidatus Kaiserbacteria bacterium]|nr:hypothetical protein [Candidatus Kaiserbacteria bacterium]
MKLRLTPRNPLRGVGKGAREKIVGALGSVKEATGIGRKRERITLADSALAGAESKWQTVDRAKNAADGVIGTRRRESAAAKAALDANIKASAAVATDHTNKRSGRIAARDTRPERFWKFFKIPKGLPSKGELFAVQAEQRRLGEEAMQAEFDADITRAEARVDEAPDTEIDAARLKLQEAREAKTNYVPSPRRSAADLPSAWQPILSIIGAGSPTDLARADSATLVARQRIANAKQAIAQAQLDRAEAALRAAVAERARLSVDLTNVTADRNRAQAERTALDVSRFPGLRSRGASLQAELQKLRSDVGAAEGLLGLRKTMAALKWYSGRPMTTKIAVGAIMGAAAAGYLTGAWIPAGIAALTAGGRVFLGEKTREPIGRRINALADKAGFLGKSKILRAVAPTALGGGLGYGLTLGLNWLLYGGVAAATSAAERASATGVPEVPRVAASLDVPAPSDTPLPDARPTAPPPAAPVEEVGRSGAPKEYVRPEEVAAAQEKARLDYARDKSDAKWIDWENNEADRYEDERLAALKQYDQQQQVEAVEKAPQARINRQWATMDQELDERGQIANKEAALLHEQKTGSKWDELEKKELAREAADRATAQEIDRQRTGAAWEEFEQNQERQLQDQSSNRLAEAAELERQKTGAAWTELEEKELAREATKHRAAIEEYEAKKVSDSVTNAMHDADRNAGVAENREAVRAYEREAQQLALQRSTALAEAFDTHGVYGGFKQEMLNADSPIGKTAKELGIDLGGRNGEALNDALHRTLNKNQQFMKFFGDNASITRSGDGFKTIVGVNTNDVASGGKVHEMYKSLLADQKFIQEFEKMVLTGPYKTLRASLGNTPDIVSFMETLQQKASS